MFSFYLSPVNSHSSLVIYEASCPMTFFVKSTPRSIGVCHLKKHRVKCLPLFIRVFQKIYDIPWQICHFISPLGTTLVYMCFVYHESHRMVINTKVLWSYFAQYIYLKKLINQHHMMHKED